MTHLDSNFATERARAVEHHLLRVEEMLPHTPDDLTLDTDESDAVILNLYQATQIVLNLASSLCRQLSLGLPANYKDAFGRLHAAGAIDAALANSLVRAVGFRNAVAHDYDNLDTHQVYKVAIEGLVDLRRFLADMKAALER